MRRNFLLRSSQGPRSSSLFASTSRFYSTRASTPIISSTASVSTKFTRNELVGKNVHLVVSSERSTSRPYSTSTTSTEVKPFEEMPFVSMQEVVELGGFMKVLDLFLAIYKRHGPVARANLQGLNAVWVFSPEDIQHVMQNEGKWPMGGASIVWPLVQIFKQNNQTNVAFAQGEEWKRLRGALQKNLFAPLDAEGYMPLITPVVEDALKVIKDHQDKLDVFLPTMTLEMIASVLFGKSLGTLNGTAPKEDHEYIDRVFQMFTLADSLLYRNPAEVKPEELKPLDDAFKYLFQRGEFHMNSVLQKHAEGKLNAAVPPYILKSADLKDVSKDEIAQNVVGLFTAGVDTTGNTIQWFLYHLSRFPEVQEKLHDEVKSVLNGKLLDKDDLPDLPYLRYALKETARLTPTTPGTARILMDEITLKGYKVPPGSLFFLAPYPTCMNPDIFENPTQFNPDRYERKGRADRKESNRYHDSAYVHMPFSRGPRMCMGARLAELEIYAFVAGFVQQYKIELAPNSPIPEAISRLTIRPEPSPKYIITPRV